MSTSIEWTDRVWNPVTGCTKVSAGCKNCYAERIAGRKLPQGGFTDREFTEVRTHEDRLTQPLSWRKEQRVFVNSMSDLVHESVPFEFIDRVFAVMALTPHITYQILTKRPERMREYWAADRWNIVEQAIEIVSDEKGDVAGRLLREQFEDDPSKYPLPNVWPGVSVENQETADKRIPELLNTPAAKRFVSYEPALGPVDFGRWIGGDDGDNHCVRCGCVWLEDGISEHDPCPSGFGPRLDWIIVGGESGPGARPFDIEWARSTVRQCKVAGVPVFVKQVGSRPFCSGRHGEWKPKDRKGGDPSEWAEDLRVREFPAVSR